ncbi:hypothetical protein SCHPADRAFT_585405 [Schizopora paradoxa]|uniref:Nephrocystin 3-like N-terminal domain-containing protein n=1 Tax=Schizopora paradoxa TaxID=27342 RepID=A0A0H2RBZ1_9AGAM|nr:hypothetical protein SCHPADRAFT_585405 [Schizopora paradoxa]
MLALKDKRDIDVQDETALTQFEKFVVGPMDTVTKESGSRSRKNPYPTVIIDALDECCPANNWDSLIKSLERWPKNLKLIITSRYHHDLHERLGEVSHRIDLATGDDVSPESRDDIKVFFEAKFKEMRSRSDFKVFKLPQIWPAQSEIRRMVDYAAGLFIWADMAVSYLAPTEGDNAGYDPDQRLQNLLSDIGDEYHRGIEGADRVDILYARIIFEAFPRSIRNERVMARRTLATILLAKAPIREGDLIELMSTDKWNSHNTVMSTLLKLRSIIPSSGKALRVCHKSVSDFALSSDRISTALSRFVPDESERNSYIIDVEEENRQLALACLHLMQRKLSTSDLCKAFEFLAPSQSQPDGFSYARWKWLNHLQDADGVYHPILPNLKSLRGAIEVAYGRLERFTGELKIESNEAVALVETIHGGIELARRCIDAISQGENNREILQHELFECAKTLDIARGCFQIAAILRREVPNTPTIAADRFLRKKLAPSDQSKLDEECVPGTRIDILSKAMDWLKNPNSPNILWIVGAPGAGKSAIATTLVKNFSSEYICGKFFVKRDIGERRNPTSIWRTLAYELACSNAGMAGSMTEALSLKGPSDTRNQEDYRDLIIKATGIQQCPVVVVIDALDECVTDLENDKTIKKFLCTVADCATLSSSFKIVVASRDLAEIHQAFELSQASQVQVIRLSTGIEASADAISDMEVYFRSERAGLPSSWLKDNVIQQLAKHAGGSFIWAKMVAGLVKLKPNCHLEDILNGDANGSTEDVDLLYGKVLVEVLGQLSESERNISRSLLAAIVLAKSPLPRSFLELLPSNDEDSEKTHNFVEDVFNLKTLSSIIAVSEDEEQLVRIPHKSFTDFFLDLNRSSRAMKQLNILAHEHQAYLINDQADNGNLAIACLRWMNKDLVFNKYGIPTSHVLNEKNYQLDRTLVYACINWGNHLKNAPCNERFCARVRPILHTILQEKFLLWLEALSLAKAVPSAEVSLRAAMHLLEGYDSDLAELVYDALKFVEYFKYPITAAASHIYISALPFSPSKSRMFRNYAPQFPRLFCVASGRREDWNEAEVTGDGHDGDVRGVAFLRKGLTRRLASVSFDRTVRVWDSKTGEALAGPFLNEISLSSMAVSPDGKLIAGGDQSDYVDSNALSIWNSKTGARKLNLIDAHNDAIASVAFSPDGSRLVTGSWDKTVKVWDTTSGELCFKPLTGHTDEVNSVAFSPDGAFIVSGSDDFEIRIWDVTDGEPRQLQLSVGHNNCVLCLAFSADGRYLASGSLDNTIRLWDVKHSFAPTSFIDSGDSVNQFLSRRKARFWYQVTMTDLFTSGISKLVNCNNYAIQYMAIPTM